jgi:hypothetical protein
LFKLALARGYLIDGDYEEAMVWVDRSLREQPRFHPSLRNKVALCGHLGRREEAQRWVQRLQELGAFSMTISGFTAYSAGFSSGRPRNLMIDGFRKAGVPEE